MLVRVFNAIRKDTETVLLFLDFIYLMISLVCYKNTYLEIHDDKIHNIWNTFVIVNRKHESQVQI